MKERNRGITEIMQGAERLLTSGSVKQKIVRFAIPIFWGNLFQQLYNAVDSLIVGNYLGSNALAAVSSSGNLIFMVVGFFVGIASGAGVIIGRYIGARDKESIETAVHTTVAVGLVCSFLMTALGMLFAEMVLRLMNTPDEVLADSVVYFRIYFAGSLGFVMYNVFMGILQAAGDSKHPLYYLIFSSVVNVGLDLLFIAMFHMGVGAAALATVLSQLFSAILCFIRLIRSKEEYRIIPSKVRLDMEMVEYIVAQGLPSGLQNSIMGFSNVVIQAYINVYGAMAMAGIGSYVKIEGFIFLPITSFTMALTTFVSQNYGAKNPERIREGTRFGVLTAMIMAETMGILLLIFAKPLIGLFDNTPEVIGYGYDRCRFVVPFFCLCAYTHGMAAVLRGLGKPAKAMMVFLFCWCVMRVIILAVTGLFVQTILTTYFVYPITWVLSSGAFFWHYRTINLEKMMV